MTAQAIQNKLRALSDLAAQLDKTIRDKKAKDCILRPALNWLSDVGYSLSQGRKETVNAPMWFKFAELQLRGAEKQSSHAQKLVKLYGADLRVVGGE
jgi:hypothetical protein